MRIPVPLNSGHFGLEFLQVHAQVQAVARILECLDRRAEGRCHPSVSDEEICLHLFVVITVYNLRPGCKRNYRMTSSYQTNALPGFDFVPDSFVITLFGQYKTIDVADLRVRHALK